VNAELSGSARLALVSKVLPLDRDATVIGGREMTLNAATRSRSDVSTGQRRVSV
jgi:hypothetical protein